MANNKFIFIVLFLFIVSLTSVSVYADRVPIIEVGQDRGGNWNKVAVNRGWTNFTTPDYELTIENVSFYMKANTIDCSAETYAQITIYERNFTVGPLVADRGIARTTIKVSDYSTSVLEQIIELDAPVTLKSSTQYIIMMEPSGTGNFSSTCYMQHYFKVSAGARGISQSTRGSTIVWFDDYIVSVSVYNITSSSEESVIKESIHLTFNDNSIADITGNYTPTNITGVDFDTTTQKLGNGAYDGRIGKYIDLGMARNYLATDEFTITLWININDTTDDYFFGADGNWNPQIGIGHTNAIYGLNTLIRPAAGGATEKNLLAVANISIANGGWNHIALVKNSIGNLTMYVNGTGYEWDNAYYGIDNSARNFYLGGYNHAGSANTVSQNNMDDFRMYDVALTSEQVNLLYNDGVGTEENLSTLEESSTVILSFPEDNQSYSTPTLDFNYTITSTIDINNCKLYINNILNKTDNNISTGIIQTFIVEPFGSGSYSWYVECTDINNNTGSSVERNFILSIPPTLNYYNLTPIFPVTESTIQLNGTCTDTDVGDTLNVTWSVYINDVENTTLSGSKIVVNNTQTELTTITSNYFVKDDIVNATFYCTDGIGSSSIANVQRTIQNTVPVVNYASVVPSLFAHTSKDLLGYCNASDSDGDKLYYYYKWYVGGSLNQSGKMISYPVDSEVFASLGAVPYSFDYYGTSCDAVSYDGDYGTCTGNICSGFRHYTQSPSSAVIIVNYTIPVNAGRVKLKYQYYASIASAHSWLYCKNPITDVWVKFDGDNICSPSGCFPFYSDYVPSECTPNFNEGSILQIRANIVLSLGSLVSFCDITTLWENAVNESEEIYVSNISSLLTEVGQNWTLECVAYDYYENSTGLNSSNTEIYNNAPVINYVNITPAPNADTTENLVGYCSASDADNDTLYYTYNWYVDDSLNLSYNNNTVFCYQETANESSEYDSGCSLNYNGNYIPIVVDSNNGYILINYSKPLNSLSSSLWEVKAGINDETNSRGTNLSIPLGCWNQDILQFRLYSYSASPDQRVISSCYDGSSWNEINSFSSSTTGENMNGNNWTFMKDGDWSTFTARVASGWRTSGIGQYSRTIYEEAMHWNIINITVSKDLTFANQNWTLECLVNDTFETSLAVNSSDTEIYVTPNITSLYITPNNPEYNDNLDCNFIGYQEGSGNLNVSITWFNSTDNVSWINNNAFDYIHVNIVENVLITTTVGTGSKVANQDNYTYWKCQATITDGIYYNYSNSSFVSIYPLENLTIYSPYDDRESKYPINATFTVIDFDNNINCTLNVDKTVAGEFNTLTNYTNVNIYFGNKENINDSDWNTYGYYNDTGELGEVYLNYSKISYATGATFRTKSGNASANQTNYGVPDVCFDAYSDAVLFKLEVEEQCLPCVDHIRTYCDNGAGYTLLNQDILYNGEEGLIYENAISWTYSNSTTITGLDSGVQHTINYTPSLDGYYNWSLSCWGSSSQSTSITSQDYAYRYDTHPIIYTDYLDNSNSMYPEINDIITLNATLTDYFEIDSCRLMINDTGVWENTSSYVINVNETYYLETTYQIKNYSTANNSNILWSVWCTDVAGNTNVSLYNNFTVQDVKLPNIQLGNNSFVNGSIISGSLYNASINVLFFDYNLFQVSVNLSCVLNGSIYAFSDLNLNRTSYELNASISLADYPLQRCDMVVQASDDHTAKQIPNYEITKTQNKGLNLVTEHGTNIILESTSVDDRGRLKLNKIDTLKLYDRYTFTFKFKNKAVKQNFTIKSNMPIYYRQNSDYPGHFVVWNTENNYGNWIDFVIKDKQKDSYDLEVTKINDTYYTVILTTDEEVDEIEFESIGGTNVENATYSFYIGGAVTINLTNAYDSGYFKNFTINVTTVDSQPGFTGGVLVPGYGDILENVSNGTYDITFSGNLFSQTYRINVTNQTSSLLGESYESILNVYVQNVATGANIIGINLSVDNLNNNKINLENETTIIKSTFYLNATDYQVNVSKYLHLDATALQTLNYNVETNLTIDMGFYANFTLYDEQTWGFFNVTGHDRVNFLIYCTDDSTNSTVLNEISTLIPVMCPYTKFQIKVFEGNDDYYRTYLINASALVHFDAYLPDLHTTSVIYNGLIADDLLNKYDNIQIWIYKYIGAHKTVITSDSLDLEGKVGAYLIENDQYLIEVHTSNYGVLNYGYYSADVSGDKIIRLYDINIPTETTEKFADTNVVIGSSYINVSGENLTYAFGMLYDDKNITNNVTFNIYQNTYSGAPILTYNQEGGGTQTFTLINLTSFLDDTLYGEMIVTYRDGEQTLTTNTIHTAQRLFLPLQQYVSAGFLNWFFLILLGTVAIMATMKSANLTGMMLIGMAGLFVLFGWFTISATVLGLALIIAIFTLFKSMDKGGIEP